MDAQTLANDPQIGADLRRTLDAFHRAILGEANRA